MSRLLILTDEQSAFLVSKADLRNFTLMDVESICSLFKEKNYDLSVCKFSELDLTKSYNGYFILYQTSEAPGGFYKRYIEDIVYHLEKQGAVVLPRFEYLKAHHNKVYMELLRSDFSDESLKSVKSYCFGSWVDARRYSGTFPVVIKQASGSAGKGVYLARNKREYLKKTKKAARILISSVLTDMIITYTRNLAKKTIKLIYPSRSGYVAYDTEPISNSLIVQDFISGLSGDYKVLFFGGRFYCMYRKNRNNDFRASGSGRFSEVPGEEHAGLLEYARRVTLEIDFPVIGMDIGFDGDSYHLIEFQIIDIGTSALQRSKFWHEYNNGQWCRYDGTSILEEEFVRAIDGFICKLKLRG